MDEIITQVSQSFIAEPQTPMNGSGCCPAWFSMTLGAPVCPLSCPHILESCGMYLDEAFCPRGTPLRTPAPSCRPEAHMLCETYRKARNGMQAPCWPGRACLHLILIAHSVSLLPLFSLQKGKQPLSQCPGRAADSLDFG